MIDELPPSIKKWADERLLAVEHMPGRAWATTKVFYLDFVKWCEANRGDLMQQAEFTRWVGNIAGIRVTRRAAGNTVIGATLPEFLYAQPDWPSRMMVAKLKTIRPNTAKAEGKRGYRAKPLDVAMTALSVIVGMDSDAKDSMLRAQVIASEALRALTGSK